MSRGQWLTSAFIVLHVGAMLLATTPAPAREQYLAIDAREEARAAGRNAWDALARAVAPPLLGLTRTLAAPRRPADRYLHSLGFDEQWTMFANPPRTDEYLRLRYVIGSREAGMTGVEIVDELLLPGAREYDVRGVQSFRDSYRDRAMNTAIDRFHQNAASRGGVATGDVSDYEPIVAFFGRRLRASLDSSRQLLRVEVWHGSAPSAMGGLSDAASIRWTVLEDYRQRANDRTARFSPAPPLFAIEREADITWTLEFVRE